MSINEDKVVEVDYDFRKGIAFMQIELGLKEEDVEEVQGKSNKAHSASFKLTEQVDWWNRCNKAFYKEQARGDQHKTFHQQDQRNLLSSSWAKHGGRSSWNVLRQEQQRPVCSETAKCGHHSQMSLQSDQHHKANGRRSQSD